MRKMVLCLIGGCALIFVSVFAATIIWACKPPTLDLNGFMPMMYKVDGLMNVRDCGGWINYEGRSIRTGRIIRSSALNGIQADARNFFVETLGVKTELDLRDEKEVNGATESPLGPKVRLVLAPSCAYADMGTDAGRLGFSRVFRTMLDERSYPVVIHCAGGRDRAGCAIFLLNAILGVKEADLIRDWELSERLCAKKPKRFYSKIEGLLEVLAAYPGKDINDQAVSFVRSLGFSGEDISKFRDLMIVLRK